MSHQEAFAEPRFEGVVTAAFPLALLESVRSHDRPGEVLEDENLSVSLPRRLGLTGVIETQIFRYESAQKARRSVRLDEVMGLVRLVLRRRDGEPILRETGQRIARWYFRGRPGLWVALLHRAPNRLGLRAARKGAERALRAIRAADQVEVAKPLTVVLRDCAPARLEENGTGCVMITGLIEEQMLLATGRPRRAIHSHCLTRGDDRCEWSLAPET